jgi:hypothetical protein
MGFYTGRKGSLTFKLSGQTAEKAVKIRDWSIQTTLEMLSTNDIESSHNTFTPGVAGATGSATLIYYRPETGEAGFAKLLSRIMKKTDDRVKENDRVELELNVDAKGKDDLLLNAYITSASISVTTGELVLVPIEFTMDGAFIETIKNS